MHGGVSAGILDEVMARCVTMGEAALNPPVWGVTVDLSLRYHAPVPLEVELTAQGRIIQERSRIFEATAELYLPDGAVAVSASGKYIKLPLDDIAGVDPTGLGWRVYPDEPNADDC
jgi:acyl-coenzyme A thioesterase PaaI-like protein